MSLGLFFFFLLPPAGRKPCRHLSSLHLPLEAGKPRDAGDRYEGKAYLCSSLNFGIHCISEEGKKRDFCFPTPDFPSPFCCSHWHCANPRIHIHHLKRQLKKSRTCKCGPFKKTGQEVLLEHSWMAFFNSRATPSWEQCPHGAFL